MFLPNPKKDATSSFARITQVLAVCSLSLTSMSALANDADAKAEPNPLDLSQGVDADDFLDSLASGTIKMNIRTRASYADERGDDTSQAYTVRTRLGYLTQAYEGFQAFVEMEDVTSFDYDRYNAGNLNNQPTRTNIADVEVTEINQLWANYELPLEDWSLSVKAGRQIIALDDQRFIGHVGWRQDNQTFDAITLKTDLGIENLELHYGYLWQINRIFGDQADWDSESHLINVSYDLESIGKLTAFGYLFDFENDSPGNSSQTVGVRLAGDQELNEDLILKYQLSAAFQEDYGDNPTDYDAMYFMADAAFEVKETGTFGAGFEIFTSDNGVASFQTPLATGHKFNGFADAFLTKPAAGLHDFYVYYKTGSLPMGWNGYLSYHYYGGEDGAEHLGDEVNAVLSKKINDYMTFTAKFAHFMGAEAMYPETSRLTFDVTLSF